MSILVTGGTGKTARALLPLLAARGVTARPASRHPANGGDRFDWYDDATWPAALDGVDGVYLVAPALDPAPERAMLPFLRRARAAGVERAVLLSAMGAEFAPDAGLSVVERGVIETFPMGTVLRCNWFMQNFSEGFLQPTIAGAGAMFVPADGPVSFVSTHDVAAVAAVVLTESADGHAGATYQLTGPTALTHADAGSIVGDILDRAVRHVPVADADFHGALVDQGFVPGYADILTGLFALARTGYAAQISPDVEQVTGRAPTPFADFAKSSVDAWRQVPVPVE